MSAAVAGTSMRPTPVLAPLLAAALACAGAGARYHDRGMDFGAVRTVVILPFTNLSKEPVAADRVRDVLSNMLLATSGIYVVPPGETQRNITGVGVTNPAAPTAEEITKLGKALKADAVITGIVREYGEIRSGSTSANVVSVSVQMLETASGKVVFAAATTRGGISMADRLLGSSGAPMNEVTEAAVDDILSRLFKP